MFTKAEFDGEWRLLPSSGFPGSGTASTALLLLSHQHLLQQM
jgi:hypothetical protein